MAPDLISIGELLIDFIAIEKNTALGEVSKFQKFPGGAPANVCVATSSLGINTGLISKVGNDPFGNFLIQAIKQKKVDASQIFRDEEHHTGIVFVESQEGIPNFMLYSGVAYNFLKPDEIDSKYVKDSKLLSFGGVLLLRNPAREAVMHCLSIAKGNIPIAFDINLREDLLNGVRDFWEVIHKALTFVDILKISLDELFDLYLYFNPQNMEPTYEQALNYFIETFNLSLIAITMGGAGSKLVVIKNKKIKYEIIEPIYEVKVIDSTGAGDAFLGAFLGSIVKLRKLESLSDIEKKSFQKILKFCNKFAGLSTTKVGAWNLPNLHLPF